MYLQILSTKNSAAALLCIRDLNAQSGAVVNHTTCVCQREAKQMGAQKESVPAEQ